MNYSLEFKGGTSTSVTFDKEYTLEEIDQEIVPEIEYVTGDNNVHRMSQRRRYKKRPGFIKLSASAMPRVCSAMAASLTICGVISR